MYLVVGASRGKTAVVRRDDPVLTDHTDKALDTLRYEFGMFHERHAVGDHAWNQDLVSWDLHLSEHGPLVIMPRVSRLERITLRVNGHQQVQVVLQFEVVGARRDIGRIARVETDPVLCKSVGSAFEGSNPSPAI
jgi:hypothetical protein